MYVACVLLNVELAYGQITDSQEPTVQQQSQTTSPHHQQTTSHPRSQTTSTALPRLLETTKSTIPSKPSSSSDVTLSSDLQTTSRSANFSGSLRQTTPATRKQTSLHRTTVDGIHSTVPRRNSPTVAPLRRRSTAFPAPRRSTWLILEPITSAGRKLISNSPPLRPIRSTIVPPSPPLTSARASVAGGEVIHCQVMLANGYHEMLNVSGSSRQVYGLELGYGIARLCRVDETRISDVNVFENDETGLCHYCIVI